MLGKIKLRLATIALIAIVVTFDDDGAAGFTINVVAQAVQTKNVVPANTAEGNEAYAAFQTVGM